MLISPRLANVIFLVALVTATFTSVLAVIKLGWTASVMVSNPGDAEIPYIEDKTFAGSPVKGVYDISPYILPISWGAVAGTVVWKGRVRSTWSKQGYDYDVFRVVARMRGSPTRIKLLNLLGLPKNKMQLAKELEMDWKTVDKHLGTLQKHNLVEEMALVGNSKYYIISEHGKKVLALLSNNNEANTNSNKTPS